MTEELTAALKIVHEMRAEIWAKVQGLPEGDMRNFAAFNMLVGARFVVERQADHPGKVELIVNLAAMAKLVWERDASILGEDLQIHCVEVGEGEDKDAKLEELLTTLKAMVEKPDRDKLN